MNTRNSKRKKLMVLFPVMIIVFAVIIVVAIGFFLGDQGIEIVITNDGEVALHDITLSYTNKSTPKAIQISQLLPGESYSGRVTESGQISFNRVSFSENGVGNSTEIHVYFPATLSGELKIALLASEAEIEVEDWIFKLGRLKW